MLTVRDRNNKYYNQLINIGDELIFYQLLFQMDKICFVSQTKVTFHTIKTIKFRKFEM